MMISGFVLAWVMYIYRPAWPGEIAEQHDLVYKFLLNKWYFDEIYDFILCAPPNGWHACSGRGRRLCH